MNELFLSTTRQSTLLDTGLRGTINTLSGTDAFLEEISGWIDSSLSNLFEGVNGRLDALSVSSFLLRKGGGAMADGLDSWSDSLASALSEIGPLYTQSMSRRSIIINDFSELKDVSSIKSHGFLLNSLSSLELKDFGLVSGPSIPTFISLLDSPVALLVDTILRVKATEDGVELVSKKRIQDVETVSVAATFWLSSLQDDRSVIHVDNSAGSKDVVCTPHSAARYLRILLKVPGNGVRLIAEGATINGGVLDVNITASSYLVYDKTTNDYKV